MFIFRRPGHSTLKLIKHFFSSFYHKNYRQTQLRPQPKPRNIFQQHRIFASQLLSSISQSQLCSLYFNRLQLACFHHSITLSKLLSFYKLNPPQSYFTKQMQTLLNTISDELESFDAESLVSVLGSLNQFAKAGHQELKELQSRILQIILGENNDLAGVDKITVLKLINVCKKVNRFSEQHQKMIEVIKIGLRKISNDIKKLSTRNIISLINVIGQNDIYTKNTEKALCREAVSRIVYLNTKQKIILLKGVLRCRSKQLTNNVLSSLKIQNISKEDSLDDIFQLFEKLKSLDLNVVKQMTNSAIQDYQKYIVQHSLRQYQALLENSKQLIDFNFVDKILQICQKYSLTKQLAQLFKLFESNYQSIKVENKLHLTLFQLKHKMAITEAFLKTKEKKSKSIFPLMLQILQYPQSPNHYDKIPQFQYLTNLSIRYFIHNIGNYSMITQLKRCKHFARLFSESSAAYETYIKLVGKYLIEHTKYSDETINHMAELKETIRCQSNHSASRQHSLGAKTLAVIQKMTNAVDLMYYAICICEEMNIRKKTPKDRQINNTILREIGNEFVKNFKLGYFSNLVTWDILRKLALIENYFGNNGTGIKQIKEYYERKNNSEQIEKKMKEVLRQDQQNKQMEFERVVNGVKVDCVHNNTAYVFIQQQIIEDRCRSLQQILLQNSSTPLKFISH